MSSNGVFSIEISQAEYHYSENKGKIQHGSQNSIVKLQHEVSEVVDILKSNAENAIQRETKLGELSLRADALEQGSLQFERRSMQLKRKYWWQNTKMLVVIGIILAVITIALIMWFAFK